jgi:hypothetical protein
MGGRRGTRTPKLFVNLTGESKNFKMLEFPLNQLQTYYGYLCDLCPLTEFIFSDLNYKMVIFLSQTESTTKHFLRKKKALAVLILNLGARRGWVVSTTRRPLYPRERPGTHCTRG